jgi:predicted Zn-dependent protease with MMP-like domain
MDDDAPEKLDKLEELLATGFDRLAEGRASEALELAETIEADDVAAAHELRALALTLLGRIDEADEALAHAAELEPEDYFRPYRLDRAEFDAAVEKTLTELPDEFREYLQNVEVGVEDVPSPELIADGLEFDLLGVYVGATADADDWGFPDRVVLFQRNLENISPDRETLLAEIRDTLLHEVGHHFGMDEDTLREIEQASEE